MYNILLVEPNKNHQNFLSTMVMKNNFFATVLSNEALAIRYMLNNKPDLLVLGCCMSEASTYNFLKYVKSHPQLSDIKILKISPSKNKDNNLKVIAAGANECLNLLDFSYERFIKTINNLINDHEDLLDDNLILNAEEEAELFNLIPSRSKTSTFNYKQDLDTIKPLISNKLLEAKLKKISVTKALPFVVKELIDITNSSNSEIKELVKLLELDPALTARVLKCANSAFYRGSKSKIYNLNEAVTMMGMNGIKDLVLGVGLLDLFGKNNSDSGLDRMKLWYHSISTAIIAREIGKMLNFKSPDSLFVAGLLHDIGTTIFDEYFTKQYQTVMKVTRDYRVSLSSVEERLLGIDHSEIAYNVMNTWRFLENISIPVLYHSLSFEEILQIENKFKKDIAIIKLASYLSKVFGTGIFDFEKIETAPLGILKYLGVSIETLKDKFSNIQDLIDELKQIIIMHVDYKELVKCNKLSELKQFSNSNILLFNEKSESIPSIELISAELDCNTSVKDNIFTIPDHPKYDAYFFQISTLSGSKQVASMMKRLSKAYSDDINVCICAPKNILSLLVNNKELNMNLVTLEENFSIEEFVQKTTLLLKSPSKKTKTIC